MIFLLCSAALAATPTILPGAPLLAGQPGLVDLWIPGIAQGARIRASAPHAHVDRPVHLPDGRVQVSVIPGDSSSLSLHLSVHGTAGREESTVVVPVVPATAGGLLLDPSQAPVSPGAHQGVDLVLNAAAGQGPPRPDHLLLSRGSLGTLKAPVHDGKNWTLHWKPPAHLDQPAYAIIGVADSAAPSSKLGWAALPLMAMVTIHATVDPGAHCALTTSSVSTDPVTVKAKADSTGQITFQLPLHPAVARGEISCKTDARTFDRAISLPAGKHPWLGWLPPPTVVPAGAQVPVQLAVINDDGAPRTVGTAPTVLASAGSVTELRLVGPGLAQGLWTAPTKPGTVRLTAKLLGQAIETTVEVSAAMPTLQVSAEPTELPAGTRITKLSISGAAPAAVWTNGLRAGRLLTHQGVGAVSLDLAPEQSLGTATIVPALPLSRSTPAALVGWADLPTLPAGTRDPQIVWLAALDEFGIPVAGIDLALRVQGGTAAATARTGPAGLARVSVTPAGDGLVVLSATSQGLRIDTPLLIGLTEGPLSTPPGTGPTRVLALRERLRAAVQTVVVRRTEAPARFSAASAKAAPLPSPAAASQEIATQAAAQALGEQSAIRARQKPERVQPPPPWARFALLGATVPHSYHQQTTGNQGLPALVNADQGNLLKGHVAGAPALHARAVLLPPALPLGLDARLQGRYEGYVVNDTAFTRVDIQGALGARVPIHRSSKASPYLLAQAEYYRVPLFEYDSFRAENPDKATGARMLSTGVLGGRLGGGVDWSITDSLLFEAEATQTLAPWPVHTRAEIGLEYGISPLMGLRAGLELGFRSMTFDLGVDQAHVRDQQHALSLGLLFLLR